MNDCTIPYGLSLGMPKKSNFRLTARKGTSRSKRKKLQGVVPQINLRSVKEEGYDVEPRTCGDDNYDIVHEREEDPEALSQDSYEALSQHDHSSPEDNGKRSVGIQVDIKLPMVSIDLQVATDYL